MITYNDLTPAQRKWVALVEFTHPEVKDTITRTQVFEFHEEFMKLRAKDKKYKVGLPLWLCNNNVLERGVYFFPAEKNTTAVSTKQTVVNPLDAEFTARLAAYGIK